MRANRLMVNTDLHAAERSLFTGPAFEEPKQSSVALTTLPTTPTSTIGLTFLTAGRAIFTVSNPHGERYTFQVSKPQDRFYGEFFASLLTGPDNLSDYTYLGMANPATSSFRLTGKSRFTSDAKPVKVLAWALKVITGKAPLPNGYAIRHAGRCGRCGRTLTVPSSIDSGIGPDCAAQMGL